MAKNQEKINRNRIREKYAREYAGKLRKKDDDIRALVKKNDELQETIRRLREKTALDGVTIMRQDELIKTLQRWTELSDSEIDALKADLEARRASREAVGRVAGMTAALSRGMGGMGAYGVLSAAFDVLGCGMFAQLFGGTPGKE